MFIMKCLPSETTGRICLAVSCWMAACVCFWKTSLASHLQGSSTTSTFTSLPGESKFHISVTDCVEGEEAPRLTPAMLHFPTKLLFSNKQIWNKEKNSLNHSIILIYHCPFATMIRQLQQRLNSITLPDNCPTNATVNYRVRNYARVGCDVVKPCLKATHKLRPSLESFNLC